MCLFCNDIFIDLYRTHVIYSRFSTEVCEDDSRVFVLFVCDAFLSGVIGMHLFLFIITNVRLDPFKINRSELLIKG